MVDRWMKGGMVKKHSESSEGGRNEQEKCKGCGRKGEN